MNKMNILKYFSLFLFLTSAIVFTGCSKSDDGNDKDKVKVADYAKNIVGTWEMESWSISLADKKTSAKYDVEVKLDAIRGSKMYMNDMELDEKKLKELGLKLTVDDFPVQRLQFDKDHKVIDYEYDGGWKAGEEKSTYDIKNDVLTMTSTSSHIMSMEILSMKQNSCIFNVPKLVEEMMTDYKLTEKFDVKSAKLKMKRVG
ncbi:hypothetical protein HMPREF3034_02221 [Prevotella sp. DNF00663]|uniref:hypothetical protein n=1 Tax=Prevotella sp. DNF00663 TaxID=1384078 RepID=UPI0007829257|nr:hypothetical protein [Prevotella sp. DNF00663]KXB79083.1 hypothetical protein HMPREF3034_02221 [Prevotella sp. DNF00663]